MASGFYFDIKNSLIFEVIQLEKNPLFRFSSSLKKNFLVLFVVFILTSFLIYYLSFAPPEIKIKFLSKNLGIKTIGISLIFLSFWFLFLILDNFFNYLKNLPPKIEVKDILKISGQHNLAEFISFDVAKTIILASNFAKRKNIFLSSPVLFYCLLDFPQKLNFIFFRLLFNKNEIKKILENYIKNEILPPNFQKTISDALKIAIEKKHRKIEIGDLLLSVAENDPIFKKILIESNLKLEDVNNLIWWLEELEKEDKERREWWKWENLVKFGSIGKEFSAGYTLTLDKFSIDLTKEVQRMGYPTIIGHEKEIEQMERILARREACNDPLIVGEAGTGRKSMILALAERSFFGQSLPEVNYHRIVQLNMQSLLSQLESIEAVEATLDTIFKEVIFAKNVILVIDEFHNYVEGKIIRPGTIDITGILAPFISRPDFRLIAITTYEGLHKNIEQHPSILSFFEKIEVSEITKEETMKLLQKFALKLETKYKILISYPALRDIFYYCEKYLPAIPFPEKALDLLEEVVVHSLQKREKIILPKHVSRVVSEKTEIPVGEIELGERERLLNLENLLHQRIINQEDAIKEVSAALRRARTEIRVRKGPIGAFLFLGPTGVGKTETAKALAEVYFGSEKRMIRLDMSEFQNVQDIPRLLGSPREEGLLTTPVRERPFSLVLLDEFEKSHPQILNLFLQVFDEGHLTDGLGRKVDFKNTIIICTSNAGYQTIFKAAKEKRDWGEVKEELINYFIEKGIFRPELLNRFDAVVVYKPLTKENLLDIAELLLKKIQKQLKTKEIEFLITQKLKEKIVELSYTPEFGARQMERVIENKISNLLAEALLRKEIKRGERIEINPDTFSIIKR
jgi:ATP-dependent Clp protease ATP-binding subunit ClpC